MKRDIERVRVLMPSDPAAHIGDEHGSAARVAQKLDGLIGKEEPLRAATTVRWQDRSHGVLPRRRVLVAGAVVTGVAVAVTVSPVSLPGEGSGQVAHAATPPVLALKPIDGRTAQQVLRQLAARVEAQDAEPEDSAVRYRKSWGWYLNTHADAPGGAANAAVPTVTEQWVRADGSGKTRSEYGEPYFPNPQTEAQARKAGLVAGSGKRSESFGPGYFASPRSVPTDPAELARLLGSKYPIEENGWRELLVAVEAWSGADDLGRDTGQQLAPRERAAFLRLLADADGLFDFSRAGEAYGPFRVYTTTTWQDQQALAVVSQEKSGQNLDYPDSYGRDTLLIDPDTGAVLGFEEALFGDPLKLNIDVPAPMSVHEILEVGRVDDVGKRP